MAGEEPADQLGQRRLALQTRRLRDPLLQQRIRVLLPRSGPLQIIRSSSAWMRM
jgi:hypothetical protein